MINTKIYDQINLWNLPDKARIKISDSYRNNFFNSAIKLAGSVTRLSNMLGIKSIRNFYCYRNSEYFTSLKIIRNMLSLFPETERSNIFLEIQRNTKKLKTASSSKAIENPKLPFKFSPLLCRTTGHIIGDGGIFNLNDGTFIAHYSNQSRILIDQFKNDIIKNFGNTEIYEFYDRRKNAYRITLPSIIGLVLTIFLGEQNDMSKHVPEKILMKNKKSKILFLRALFDDEGCVNLGREDGSCRCIEFSNDIKGVIETIKIMLEDLHIKTGKISIRNNRKNRLHYRLFITGKLNIVKFAKEVGFDHKDKKKKLNMLIRKYN